MLETFSHTLPHWDHTLPLAHICPFSVNITGNLIIKDMFRKYLLTQQKFNEPQKQKNYLTAERPHSLFQKFTESVYTTKHQILTLLQFLSVGMEDQTAGLPQFCLSSWQPLPSCPRGSACLCTNSQNCFLHVGGPRHFKGALCRSSTGVTSSHGPAEQDCTCLRTRTHMLEMACEQLLVWTVWERK